MAHAAIGSNGFIVYLVARDWHREWMAVRADGGLGWTGVPPFRIKVVAA